MRDHGIYNLAATLDDIPEERRETLTESVGELFAAPAEVWLTESPNGVAELQVSRDHHKFRQARRQSRRRILCGVFARFSRGDRPEPAGRLAGAQIRDLCQLRVRRAVSPGLWFTERYDVSAEQTHLRR